MNETAERPSAGAGLQDLGRLGVGAAAVHDQRQAGRAGGGDVGAEDFDLTVTRAVVVVEVEAGFADPDHLGMPGQFDEALDANVRFAGGFMRVNADRAVDVVIALGDRAHAVELADARADGHHRRDAGGAGARYDGIQLAALLLVVVEVAMAIDESHDGAGAPSPAST